MPEYAELLTQMNKRLHPFVVGGKGTAEEALNGLAPDWDATFKKYGRYSRSSARILAPEAATRPSGHAWPESDSREERSGEQSMTTLDAKSRAARPRLERSRDPQPVHHSDDRCS